MTKKTETIQIDWSNRLNILYGSIGVLLIVQLGANGAWKSFAAGWLIAVVNLELLKRIGRNLLALFESETKLPVIFYVVIVMKFSFWALILALFSTAQWLQGIPFVLGMLTLIVSAVGLGLSVREQRAPL